MMSDESDKICKESASKSNNDRICDSDIIGKLQNMSTANTDSVLCANCGRKEMI